TRPAVGPAPTDRCPHRRLRGRARFPPPRHHVPSDVFKIGKRGESFRHYRCRSAGANRTARARLYGAVLTGRERQGRHSAIARVITLARPPRLIFPGVLYYDLPLAPGNQVGEVE